MVKTIFNETQLDFIKNNYLKMTYKEMSLLDLFDGINEKQLRNKARNMGYQKTRSFNDSFFETIDSKEKAYWLGFIYADGYILFNEEKSNYELGVSIHSKDSYLLEYLNISLGNMHNITFRKREIEFNGYKYINDCCEFRVYSKKLCSDLIKNKIVCNKTNSNIHPTIEDEVLFYHMLRGFLDGDGSIYKKDDKIMSITFTNSNSSFLEYIQERLKNQDIKSDLYKETEKKYKLFISRYDHQKFLQKIYKDSENLRLKRKYDLYYS